MAEQRSLPCWLALASLLPLGLRAQDPPQPAPAPLPTFEVMDIQVRTRNIFGDEEAERNLFYHLANLIHVPTDPAVVRRELWFGVGDTITLDEAEELERNLRGTGLLAEAQVLLDPRIGLVDIDTRDRQSLVAGAAPSVAGGVGSIASALRDFNLFGTGKELGARLLITDIGERKVSAFYRDPQLFGTWHTLDLDGGETDEGSFGLVAVERPFKHLHDPWSHGVGAVGEERIVDYFQAGDSVAEVPEERLRGRAELARGFGPRDLRGVLGIELEGLSLDYRPARGPQAAMVRVPGDTQILRVGPFASLDWVHGYHKRNDIDTIDFLQDLRLGLFVDGRVSLLYRDEDRAPNELQYQVQGGVRGAAQPFADTYLTVDCFGRARWFETKMRGWWAGGSLHVYQTSLPAQTLAANLAFDAASEQQDLQPQFTLGEDNGLRGYPAREFSGSRRLRVNLEDRIDTGVEILTLRFGLVVFYDMGWTYGSGQSLALDDAFTAAGVGLRFGSSNLLGPTVVRIDVAWPLRNQRGVEDYGTSVSLGVNQVFGFFGQRSELRSDFVF